VGDAVMLRYLVMTGETGRLMTDSAQAELVHHVVTMGSNLQKKKKVT
jgi:hypothetical protein